MKPKKPTPSELSDADIARAMAESIAQSAAEIWRAGQKSQLLDDPTRTINGHRLIHAVRSLSEREVKGLLMADTDVNVQDGDGMTALHYAALTGARPCIRLLVKSGQCDYLIQDVQGRYAFELAVEWARDYAVGRLLARKQAQQAAAMGITAYIPRA